MVSVKTRPNVGYRWIITADYIGTDSVGVEGPKDLDLTCRPFNKFRMYDDDKTILYEGLIGGDFYGFEPLDDFGAAVGGCTAISYRLKNGEWALL